MTLAGENAYPQPVTSVVYRVRGLWGVVLIRNNAIIGTASNRHTWARLERHLPLPVTVNQRFVLLSVVKDVTRRRLCDGVPADSPGRDIELSASPPRRLLDRSQGQSRKSTLGSTERVP